MLHGVAAVAWAVWCEAEQRKQFRLSMQRRLGQVIEGRRLKILSFITYQLIIHFLLQIN